MTLQMIKPIIINNTINNITLTMETQYELYINMIAAIREVSCCYYNIISEVNRIIQKNDEKYEVIHEIIKIFMHYNTVIRINKISTKLYKSIICKDTILEAIIRESLEYINKLADKLDKVLKIVDDDNDYDTKIENLKTLMIGDL